MAASASVGLEQLIMRPIAFTCAMLFLFSLNWTAHAQSCGRIDSVIEDAALVDVAHGVLRSRMSVAIGCGAIVAVGPSSIVRASRAGLRISGGGLFLMPGLTDAHMHLKSSPDDLLVYLAYGITTVRNMDGTPEHVRWRNEVNAGSRVGPTIYTSGPILNGGEPQWRQYPELNAAARAIVAEHQRIGYDYVKVYFQLNGAQYDALVLAARQAGLPVVGHVPNSQTVSSILTAGQWTNEHLTGFAEELQTPDSPAAHIGTAWGAMVRYRYIDRARLPGLIERVAHYRHWNVPTLISYEVFTRPEEVRALLADQSAMSLLAPETREDWRQYNPFQIPDMDSFSADDREVMRTAVQERRRMTMLLLAAHAGIAAGTDAPVRFVFPGLSLHQELQAFVAAGMTPGQALQTATINAAAALAHEREFGAIEVGQRADLLLVRGNPLADISATRAIEGVMAHGQWRTRRDLDALMDGVRARRRRAD